MGNFLAPGVRVREQRAGVPQIRGVTTSVSAFIGRTLRGEANRAIRVTSFPMFQRIFGSYDQNSYLPESVDYFFKNGGSECYIVRALGSTGGTSNTKASKTLTITGGSDDVMVVTAKGEGTDGNNFNVLVVKEANKISSSIPTLIAAGSTTQFALGAAICAKLTIGDTVYLYDSAGPDNVRIVVAGIANGVVNAAAAVTVPVGGLAAATTSVTIETFSFTVLYAGSVIYGPQTGLRVSSLSKKDYFVTRINTNDDEVPVTVTDSAPTFDGTTDNRPVNTDTTNGDALASGAHHTTFADADYIGVEASGTGFYALDKIARVRQIACPGVTGTTTGAVSKALVQYAALRQNCVAVICPPLNTTPANAVTYKADNIGGDDYGIMDYPWVKTLSPITNQLTNTPTEGFRMGRNAAADREFGVQSAPAGEVKGRLVGTYGVERVLTEADRELLYPANINPIENIDDVGQCLMGSRTMGSGEFNQIHVRRTFIYLRESLKIGTRFVIFEENTPATRAKLKRTIDGFLENEWYKGTLTGNTTDEAYNTVCNDSNNPNTIVKAQQMVADVSVNIPSTTENLTINIQQDQRGSAKVAA
jgi:phage tail sheath protein FI